MTIGGRKRRKTHNKWVQKVDRGIKRRGTKGKFTCKTDRYNRKHGTRYSVLGFACHVRNHPSNFTTKTEDEANFALNVNKSRFRCKSRKKSRRRSSRKRRKY